MGEMCVSVQAKCVMNKLIKIQLFSMWQTKLQRQVAVYISITTIDKRSIPHKATKNLQLTGLITLCNKQKTS